MSHAIRSLDASSTPTKSFELAGEGVALKTSSAAEPCKVFSIGDYLNPEAQVPAGHAAIGDLVAKWEEVPERRAAIARARSRLMA